MKLDKDALQERLMEKTTWIGLAGIVVSLLGLPAGSEEQLAILLASIIPLLWAEKK